MRQSPRAVSSRAGSVSWAGVTYVALALWSVGWFFARWETRRRGLDDWLDFEFGARTLIHLNSHYATGGLHLYAHYPVIQIGPPPLLLVAALQWLSPATVSVVLGLVMALLGLGCLRCAEVIVEATVAPRVGTAARWRFAAAGAVATACWSWDVATWQHLDDVMAITGLLAAMALISRAGRWWLAAILLGLAIATKPWALVMAPVLLGLPREVRARAVLVMLAALAAPWLPFVVAAPGTVSSLAGFHFTVDPRAAIHALGLPLGVAPSWARPVQLLVGLALAAVAVRRGRWAAVPLLVLGFRVVSDPQSWAYYGLAPLVGAVLWDLAAPDDGRLLGRDVPAARVLPVWTPATAVVMFGVRAVAPTWAGWGVLVWFVCVVTSVVLAKRTDTVRDRPQQGVSAQWPRPMSSRMA